MISEELSFSPTWKQKWIFRKESQRETGGEKDSTTCWKEHVSWKAGGFMLLKDTPGWQLGRKWKPEPHSHKEMNSATNLDKRGNGFPPPSFSLSEPPHKKELGLLTPWFLPCETWTRKTRQTCHHWLLNNKTEIINLLF